MKKLITLFTILTLTTTIFNNCVFCQYLSETDEYGMLDDFGKGKVDGVKLASKRCRGWPYFWGGFASTFIVLGIMTNEGAHADINSDILPTVELALVLTIGLPVPRADVPPRYIINKSKQYQLGYKLGYQSGKRGKRLTKAYWGALTGIGVLIILMTAGGST
jgi:hypothetical protein